MQNAPTYPRREIRSLRWREAPVSAGDKKAIRAALVIAPLMLLFPPWYGHSKAFVQRVVVSSEQASTSKVPNDFVPIGSLNALGAKELEDARAQAERQREIARSKAKMTPEVSSSPGFWKGVGEKALVWGGIGAFWGAVVGLAPWVRKHFSEFDLRKLKTTLKPELSFGTVNLRRGLFRLWLLLSAIWIVFWSWQGNILNDMAFYLGPPVLIGLIGWVTTGFKSDRPSSG
jgi:hypothetical protein